LSLKNGKPFLLCTLKSFLQNIKQSGRFLKPYQIYLSDMRSTKKSSAKKLHRTLLHCVVLVFLILNIETAYAQDWRLSGGYNIQHFGIDFTPNPGYKDDIAFTQKGFLHVELERYLLHRFYISLQGDYLVNNQESVFLDGPINFNQAVLGLNAGLQWSRLGIYGGGHLGNTWNLRFKDGDTASDPDPLWIAADGRSSTFSAGYQFGVKYYLLRFVRLEAQFRNTVHLSNDFHSQSSGGQTAQISSFQFTPNRVTVGISISIPWRSRSRLEQINRRDRLPALMELRGVNFSSPVSGNAKVTSTFGERWGRNHEGVDLDARRGDQILAAASGVVIVAGTERGFGRTIVIRHGSSYTTRYAHLHRISVREGQRVRRGDVIGTAGDSGTATGVHLHFEIRRENVPLDPQRYIRF
jgi:murein DD-endopeptidase MepM/ murein hydrolase activator NlpD